MLVAVPALATSELAVVSSTKLFVGIEYLEVSVL